MQKRRFHQAGSRVGRPPISLAPEARRLVDGNLANAKRASQPGSCTFCASAPRGGSWQRQIAEQPLVCPCWALLEQSRAVRGEFRLRFTGALTVRIPHSPDASWHLSLARHAGNLGPGRAAKTAGMIGPCPGWHQLAIRCHPRPHHRLVGSLRAAGADPGRRDDSKGPPDPEQDSRERERERKKRSLSYISASPVRRAAEEKAKTSDEDGDESSHDQS
ncbi:hypothetical protein J3F83DRAFT_643012 [Trichoderma novae-zelandiae]